MKKRVRVVRKTVTRLRRGDAILAIRWRDCSQRKAGVSQRTRVIGYFVMRHAVGEDFVAVAYRDPQGKVQGHESRYSSDCVAFVLKEVGP